MIKKTTILAIVVLLTLLSGLNASAQETVTQGHVVYTLENDHYEATDLASGVDTLVIADQVGGKPVTVIAARAFDATRNSIANQLVHVVMGANVKTIGSEAFFLCTNLKSVVFNQVLTHIEKRAFFNCSFLDNLQFPESLQEIGNSAFLDCRSLSSLVLPAGLQLVDVSAFYHCNSLQTLTVKSDVLHIGVTAFAQSGLRTVRFLGALPTIDDGAFNATGTSNSPVSYYVPKTLLSDYVALTTGNGSTYRWSLGGGWVRLRTAWQGLIYDYVAPDGASAAQLYVSAIDEATLINKGSEKTPAYLAQSVASLEGFAVSQLTSKTNFIAVNLQDSIFAIDLRAIPLTGINVDRTEGQFAGVPNNTFIYLPSGNTSTETNVVIGGEMAARLQSGRPSRTYTEESVANGRATWMLNSWWGTHVFGQQIGTDNTPVPMANSETQTVWQADFIGNNVHQYRYANSQKNIELPSAKQLGYEAETVINFYIDDTIDRPFTATTLMTEDLVINARQKANALTLNADTLSLRMSQDAAYRKVVLSATVLPEQAHQEVTWTSGDPKVATVDADGTVWGLSPGQTVITATSRDNAEVKAQCQLTVIPRPEGVVLEESEVTITNTVLADPVYQIKWKVYPEGAIQDVLFESQDESIATVDANGLITGVRNGVTFINITPVDNKGISSLCKVKVLPPAGSVWINRNTSYLLVDERVTLRAVVLPTTVPQQVTWTSEDPTIATVSSVGIVTALKPGVTTITVTADCAPTIGNKCVVTVLGPDVSLSLNGISYYITQLDADAQTMKVTHVEDSLLINANSLKIPATVTHSNIGLTVTEVAEDAIGKPIENAFVYIPKGIKYQGNSDNVVFVKDGEQSHSCYKAVISQDFGFKLIYPFTAEKMEFKYTSEGDGQPFTICLPFSTKSSEQGICFYEMKSVNGDSIIFEAVETTVPYMPYLATSSQKTVDLGANDVEFPALSRIMTVIKDDIQFVPVAMPTTVGEAAIINGYLPNGKDWSALGDSDILPPFSAWLYSPRSTPIHTKLTVPDNDETAIKNVVGDKDNNTPIYDLNGRKMGTDKSYLPAGIYIRNGKKFVK